MAADNGPRGLPPGASIRAHRIVRELAGPVERFLHIEAASGTILLVMAGIALVWANSPWVAFRIMPLFALANAGVALGGPSGGGAEARGIALGVGLGLVVGGRP